MKLFSKIFQNLFNSASDLSVIPEAGAKVSQISESPKDLGTFFKLFQNQPFVAFERCFSLEAGAKIRTFPGNFQIIPGLFFDNFHAFFSPDYGSAS